MRTEKFSSFEILPKAVGRTCRVS